MFQFGELLTLAIGVVALAYVVANWRRIRSLPTLRPLVIPFVLIALSWLFTVVEGVFLTNVPFGQILMLQPSVGGSAEAGTGGQILNLLEHLANMSGAVALLVVVLTVRRETRRGDA